MQVVGQAIVIHDASVFKLIRRDDRVIAFMKQLCSVNRLVASFVAVTFLQQDSPWDAQTYPSVNTAAFVPRLVQALLDITLKGSDLVSQEFGSLASCMGDERLFLREMELELIDQKVGKLSFDFFRF